MADENQIQEPPKLSVDDFAAKIKAKYPDYKNVDNSELVKKIVAKYPEYGSHVDLNPPKAATPIFQQASNNFLNPSIIKPQTGYLTPIIDSNARQQEAERQYMVEGQQANDKLSRQIKQGQEFQKLVEKADPETVKNWDKVNQLMANHVPDQLREYTPEEQKHYEFMQTPVGKTLGAVAYLGSKATKGSLQIIKGAAHLANMGLNATNPYAQMSNEEAINKIGDKADKLANYGLTQGDIGRMEESKPLSALGMAAEFAPAVATGEAANAPKALMYLQGVGQGKDAAENIEKNGGNLNPVAKEALIQGSGLVNLLLTDVFKGSKVSSALQDKVVTGIAADAIKESAGKDLSAQSFKDLLQNKAQTFAQKLERAPLEALGHYNETAKTFLKLNAGNFAVHKSVDALNEKPVFNETLGNLAENSVNSITKDAPIFAALPAAKELTKLLPNTAYHNDVVDAIVKDPSQKHTDDIKAQIMNHASEQGWNDNELHSTLDHVNKIAEAAKAIPKDIPNENKRTDAIGLVIDRNTLQDKLNGIQEAKKSLDPAIQEIHTAQEQYLTDKIEQANDKLRDIVSGTKTTYSKERDDKGQETGKFLKSTDGKQEEITPERYNLERTERDAKVKDNVQENPVAEPTTIKESDNGKIDEMGGKPNGQEAGQSGDGKNEIGIPQESTKENGQEKVVKSGAGETVPDKLKDVQVGNRVPISRGDESGIVERMGVDGDKTVLSVKGDDGKLNEVIIPKHAVEHYEQSLNELKNAIQKQSTGEMVLRQQETVGEGVGGQDEPKVAPAEIEKEQPKEKEIKAGDTLRKLADRIDAGKINKLGGFKASTGFDALWDTSLQVVSTSLRGGAKLADAIEEGLKHIRQSDWYKNLTDKKDFEAKYAEHLNNELSDTKEDVATEQPKKFVTSAKNADTDKLREKLGLSPLMKAAARANPEVWDEVLARLDTNPQAADDLIKRLEVEMRPVTDVEQGLLVHKQIELETTVQEASQRIIDNKKKGIDDKFDDINLKNERDKLSDLIKLQNKVGREWGLSGKFRQQLYKDDFSLASLERKTMAVLGGRDLTPKELDEIQKVHDEFNKKLKDHEDIIAGLQKRNADLEAEKALKKLKKDADFEQRKAKRQGKIIDYDKQIKDTITDIRAKLKKARSEANVVPIPYAKELIAIAPELGELAKAYISKGITNLEDIVDKIHHDLKDDFDNLDKRAVRDALSGYGKESKKQTRDEIQTKLDEIKREAKLMSQLEDLKNGLAKAKTERAKDNINERIEDLKKQIRELTPQDEAKNKSYITRMQNMQKELEAKLKSGDFDKTVRVPIELSEEARASRAAYLRVKKEFETALEKKRLANRSKIEKASDWFVKWRRNVLFLNPSTFVKLGTYASLKMLSKPLHELIGSGLRKLPYLSKIAEKAPREGHAFNVQAEAKAFAQMWSKSTWSDIKKNLTNKEGDLQVINDGSDETTRVPDAKLLDIGASLHSAIKQIPKHAEFERSLILRTKYAYEHGLDVSNQLVQLQNVAGALKDSLPGSQLNELESKAYQDSLRDILMQDNVVSKAWSGAINQLSQLAESGKLNKTTIESTGIKNAAKSLRAAMQIFIPITKVPVNFVIDRAEYTPIVGAVRAMLIMRRGLSEMKPEEADYVMRVFKKQGIGAGMLAFGYLNPNMFGGFQVSNSKRTDDQLKANDIEVFGYKIPHFMTHTAFLSICQLGATLRHIADDEVEGKFTVDKYIKATDRGGSDAAIANVRDIAKTVPFMDTPTRLMDAVKSKESWNKFIQDFTMGLVLPPDIKTAVK